MKMIDVLKEKTTEGGIYVTLSNGEKTTEGWVPHPHNKSRFDVTGVELDGFGGSLVFNAKGKMIKNNIFNNEDTWTIKTIKS